MEGTTYCQTGSRPPGIMALADMENEPAGGWQCPYCALPGTESTDDHIFPQFLGGRKTTRVCKKCNNAFGHTFEGRAANQLKRLQVFISHFGLNLTRTSGTWPAALEIGDDTFDLQSGPEGVQYFLAKPTIRRDAEGKVIGGRARSMKEAKRIAKGLIDSGQAKEIEISTNEDAAVENIRLTVSLSFDPDLYRLATKMTAAVLVAFGRMDSVTNSSIPAYLHRTVDRQTSPAYCDIDPIRGLRPPLSHAIYVELGELSYGIVLFFGFLKVYVPLLPATEPVALIGSLDPLTGSETFQHVKPIGPRTVPAYLFEPSTAQFQEMCDALTREAISLGATRPPTLQAKDLELASPIEPAPLNGTIRYLFPFNQQKR